MRGLREVEVYDEKEAYQLIREKNATEHDEYTGAGPS